MNLTDRIRDIARRALGGRAALVGVGSWDPRWSEGLGDAAKAWVYARAAMAISESERRAAGDDEDRFIGHFVRLQTDAQRDFERRAEAIIESIARAAALKEGNP